MGWVSPTGYEDPEAAWADQFKAYDEDTNTFAFTGGSYDECTYTPFLILTRPAIQCDKIRFWLDSIYAWNIDNVDVDVLRDGTWVHVYDGNPPRDQWVEASFTQGSVTKARFRGHISFFIGQGFLQEFDFWEVEVPPAVGYSYTDGLVTVICSRRLAGIRTTTRKRIPYGIR